MSVQHLDIPVGAGVTTTTAAISAVTPAQTVALGTVCAVWAQRGAGLLDHGGRDQRGAVPGHLGQCHYRAGHARHRHRPHGRADLEFCAMMSV
ncbi:MAG: hypothetical protein ACOYXR_07410 [Nitrospirota bacterium]